MKVFLTMLAVKDADHVVRKTAYQLAILSRKTEVEVLEALKVLSSPDTRRLERQAHEGRRIRAVEEGWLVLNGEKYRQAVSLEMKRARNRRAQAAWRERQKQKHVPDAYEREAMRCHEQGDQAGFDAAVTRSLPERLREAPPEYAAGNGQAVNPV